MSLSIWAILAYAQTSTICYFTRNLVDNYVKDATYCLSVGCRLTKRQRQFQALTENVEKRQGDRDAATK